MTYHKYKVQFSSGFSAPMLAHNSTKAIEAFVGKDAKCTFLSADKKSILWHVTPPSGDAFLVSTTLIKEGNNK